MAISERLFPKLDENGQEKAKDYMELLLQSGLYSQKNSIIYQFPRRTLKLYDLPVSAGTGQFLDSDSFSEMEVGNEVSAQADFGVRVSGDSMEPLYLNGQIIWIHRQDTLVYDLLNCLILDYTNCPKTAQFCVHNSPLVSPECSLRRYYFIQPIR